MVRKSRFRSARNASLYDVAVWMQSEGSSASVNEIRILGSFDNLKSRHMRLLQEAARLGPVHVLLLSDQAVAGTHRACGRHFPQEERRYFVQAVRYVDRLTLVEHWRDAGRLPGLLRSRSCHVGRRTGRGSCRLGAPCVLRMDWHTS